MKLTKIVILILALLVLAGCDVGQNTQTVQIELSDSGITVDGKAASTSGGSVVYTAKDIVYYEAGKGFTYGEGTEKDAHTAQEAAAHTVVHITKPGTYRLSGKLSKGQIAVDLGEDAEGDPNAVVTLILNGVDITCEVAPAVIFYNVYECGDKDTAKRDVDTSAAGANVVIADGTQNNINGSYVARIYKPGSVELNKEGTKVKDSKKLHKYDAAFYSKMSMNISGGGTLNIRAENEGLDSEMHLTVDGGNINIFSGNDGINTNEDGVSVTTINGGVVNIQVTGETGEGDGIDSNGWLVINGGEVYAAACSTSMDSGIDSDMGIHINGGTVIAAGGMLDRIQDGGQTYAVFSFDGKQSGADTFILKDEKGNTVMSHCPKNDWSILVYSSDELKPGTYTLWNGDQQLGGQSGMAGKPGMGFGGGQPPHGEPPEGFVPPEEQGRAPFDEERPEGIAPPGGERPEGFTPPEGGKPQGRPEDQGGRPSLEGGAVGERAARFVIQKGGNMFSGIAPLE